MNEKGNVLGGFAIAAFIVALLVFTGALVLGKIGAGAFLAGALVWIIIYALVAIGIVENRKIQAAAKDKDEPEGDGADNLEHSSNT